MEKEKLDDFANEVLLLIKESHKSVSKDTRLELVRDQFVAGIQDGYIQEKVLQPHESPTNLDSAPNIARRIEAAQAAGLCKLLLNKMSLKYRTSITMHQAAAKNMLFFKSKSLNVNFDLSKSSYKALENIGTGAYGVVCSAEHSKTGKKVAIKKIPNAFDEITTAKRTFRELKILRHFDHENVIGIRELLMPKEPLSEFKDVYVVMDLMESDLHQILHSHQPFTIEHTRYFLYQILRGLKYIHSANVIHRDLKPSNLLVNENCELKIGDFGMARGISAKNDNYSKMFMTQYVATRWYRAPELLFSVSEYSESVDMWSVGCIFAEMLSRRQLFPGKNPMDQLTLIFDILGVPPEQMLKSTNSEQITTFFQKKFGNKKPLGLKAKLRDADPIALELLKKMLIISPAERISVLDALKDPFLEKYHDPDDEPDCFPLFDFSFDQQHMKTDQIRQQIGKMILKYNRPKFGKLNFPSLANVTKEQPAKPATVETEPVTGEGVVNNVPKTSSNLQPLSQSQEDFQETVSKSSSDNVGKGAIDSNSGPKIPDTVFVKPATPPNVSTTSSSNSLSLSSQQLVGDVEMISARSACNDAVNSILVIAAENTAASETSEGVCTKGEMDVDMESAQCVSSNNMLAAEGCDVHMLSASGEGKRLETGEPKSTQLTQTEKNLDALSDDNKPVGQSNKDESSDDIPSVNKVEDTKALVRAALKNSLLKNKMRKERSDSNASDPEASKTAVTALSRHREREEKRRMKMKRSQNKHKKLKACLKDQEKRELMLSEQDRSMLERWNKMQTAKGSGAIGDRWKSEPNIQSSLKLQLIAPKPCATVSGSFIGGATSQTISGKQNVITTTLYTLKTNTVTPTVSVLKASGAVLPENVSLITNQTLMASGNGQNVILLQPVTQASQLHQNQGLSLHDATKPLATVSNTALTLPASTVPSTLPGHMAYQNIYSNGHQSTKPNPQSQLGEFSSISLAEDNSSDFQSVFFDSGDLKLQSPFSGDAFLGSLGMTSPLSIMSPGRYRSCSDRETPSPPVSTQNNSAGTGITGQDQVLGPENLTAPAGEGAGSFLPQDDTKVSSTPPDVAAIINQLARSAVEDKLPFLELTPRGDGTGYGLGLNLEELLSQTLEEGDSPEDSSKSDGPPLSASVLSGILQEHNLNPDDMKAMQVELGLTSLIIFPKLSPTPHQKSIPTP